MGQSRSRVLACACLLSALWVSQVPLVAQELRGLEFMSHARRGFDQLYSLEYDEAQQTFRDLKSRYPDHPAPPLYLALAVWLAELFQRQDLNLDHFIAPGYFTEPDRRPMSTEARTTFLSQIEMARALCQRILEDDSRHRDARYFLGMAEGIRASFAITIDHNKGTAFDHGKKAYRHHKRLIEDDPTYYDAYLTVGLYQYIVANLPWYIKWLAFIVGFKGDEQRGLRYLSLAAERGLHASRDARVLQMVLLVREQRYSEALEIAQSLHREYPANYLFHLNRAQILERMGQTEEAISHFLQVVERAEQQIPNYQKLPLQLFYFDLGQKLMDLEHHQPALDQFQKLLARNDTPVQKRALAHLRTGQIYDLLHDRSQALNHYRQVLEHPDFADSHDSAEDFLKTPYTP